MEKKIEDADAEIKRIEQAIENAKVQLQKLYDKAIAEVGESEVEPGSGDTAIIITDDLSPSETVQIDKEKILAFVTNHGSTNCHTAILTRMMNIPALIGVSLKLEEIKSGTLAVVNGFWEKFMQISGVWEISDMLWKTMPVESVFSVVSFYIMAELISLGKRNSIRLISRLQRWKKVISRTRDNGANKQVNGRNLRRTWCR